MDEESCNCGDPHDGLAARIRDPVSMAVSAVGEFSVSAFDLVVHAGLDCGFGWGNVATAATFSGGQWQIN